MQKLVLTVHALSKQRAMNHLNSVLFSLTEGENYAYTLEAIEPGTPVQDPVHLDENEISLIYDLVDKYVLDANLEITQTDASHAFLVGLREKITNMYIWAKKRPVEVRS